MFRRGLCALYLIGVTALWLYVQFPAQTVREYAVAKAARLVPGLDLSIGEVALGLPPGVRFDAVGVGYRGDPALRLGSFHLTPGWRTLLPDRLAAGFRARVGEGTVRGRVETTTAPSLSLTGLRTRLEDVEFGDLPILDRLIGRDLAGRCSGELEYTADDSPAALAVRLRLENGRVAIRQPALKRRALSFDRVEAELGAQESVVTVQRLLWRGPEMDGGFSGRIEVRRPLVDSTIDLQGEVQPHAAFLKELRQAIPERLMPRARPGGRYTIQLYGTLGDPRYRFI